MTTRDDLAPALVGLLTRDGWTQYRNSPAAAESVVRGEWMPHLTPLLNRLCAEAAAEALERAADELPMQASSGIEGLKQHLADQQHLRALAAAANPSKEQQP